MLHAGDALVGYDAISKFNVLRIEARFVGGSAKRPKILVEVSPIGAPSGAVELEFLFVKKFDNKEEPTPAPQVAIELPAGSGKCEFTEFVPGESKILGWCARVIKDGRIIGVAGSGPKFVELAANPATKMRYGKYLKTLATN